MLRLTLLSQTSVETVLALDGWLMGEEVALLAQEGRYWLQEPGRLVLDLGGVQLSTEKALRCCSTGLTEEWYCGMASPLSRRYRLRMDWCWK